MNRPIICRLGLVVVLLVGGRAYSEEPHDDMARFQPTLIQIDDRFDEDSRNDYSIGGDVQWSLLKLTCAPQSTLAIVKTMAPDLTFEVDMWPRDMEEGRTSISQMNLLLTNQYEIAIAIFRVRQNGRLLRQAIINQIRRPIAPSEKAQATVLRRLPAFTLKGDVERWSVRYDNGVIQLACNGQALGEVYSDAFASWVRGVAIGQKENLLEISRLSLSGETIDYSKIQREAYKKIVELQAAANSAVDAGKLEQGVTLMQQVISLQEEKFGKDNFAIGLSLRSLGDYLELLGRRQESTRAYTQSSQQFAAAVGGHHPETLLTDVVRAEGLAILGRLDESEACVRRAVKGFSRLDSDGLETTRHICSRVLVVWWRCAMHDNAAGKFDAALIHLREVLETSRRILGTDHPITKQAESRVALQERVVASQGQEREQFTTYLKKVDEIRRLSDQSRHDEAAQANLQLLPLACQLLDDDSPELAALLLSGAITKFNQGERDLSARWLHQGYQAFLKSYGADHPDTIYAQGLMANQLSMAGSRDHATAALREWVASFKDEESRQSELYANAKLAYARHLIRLDRPREALRHLEEALQVYAVTGHRTSPNAIKAMERLADVHRSLGNLEQAENIVSIQRELVTSTYGTDSTEYVEVLTSEARHLFMHQRYDEAEKKYEAATELIDRVFGPNSRAHEPVIAGLVEVNLWKGDLSAVATHYERWLEYELNRRENLFNILNESQQFAVLENELNSLDALLILTLKGYRTPAQAYEHAVHYKGAVTARQRGTHLALSTPESHELINQLIKVDTAMATAQATDWATAGGPVDMDELQKKHRAIEEQLFQINRAYHLAVQRPSVDDLQRLLPEGTVLIDYLEYKKPQGFIDRLFGNTPQVGLVAFVVPSQGAVELVDLGALEKVESVLRSWRATMYAEPLYARSGNEQDVAELTDRWGAALRRVLWDPLGDRVADAKAVLISPSTHLAACPFVALPAADGSFLIEKHAISCIAAPRLLPELIASQQDSSSSRLILVGNIDYDSLPTSDDRKLSDTKFNNNRSILPLPDSSKTTQRILSLFKARYPTGKTQLLTGGEATEAILRQQMPGAAYIHFDTHGFCWVWEKDSNRTGVDRATLPTISGIALAGANHGIQSIGLHENDGILLAEELRSLDLQHAELVTLAACNTAVGQLAPGEGMLGAQRALLVAGARASVATLWPIEDLTTQVFMQRFYRSQWEEGLSKSQALQAAMIFMLRNYQWRPNGIDPYARRTPPYLWAAFVLHGDWQ